MPAAKKNETISTALKRAGEPGAPRKESGASGRGTGGASTRSGTVAEPLPVVGRTPDASTGSVPRRRPRRPPPPRDASEERDGATGVGAPGPTDGRVLEPSSAWAAPPVETVIDPDLEVLFDGVASAPPWRRAFLVGLAHTGNISLVCRTIGISRQAYYQTLEQDDTLQSEVDSAMRAFGDRLVAEALRRAVVGVPRYVVSQGRVVEVDGKPLQQMEYSDLLLDRLLKAHLPELFRERYDLNHGGDIPMKVYVGMDMDEL